MNHARVWETPEHDTVALYFFDIQPNIPDCATVEALSAFYVSGVESAGGRMVECRLQEAAQRPAIRVLIKTPQQPRGWIYVGTLTLPFRDFSYVVKVQCPEVGMTGVREAVLADRRMAAGEMPSVGGPGPPFPGWNPDAPEHDADFPTHPVARTRRLLDHVARSVVLDETVGQLPRFGLPGSVP